MKNYFMILAVVSVVGMLASCNGNAKASEYANEETETKNVEANVEQDNEESAPEPETYYHYSDYQITLPTEKWEVNIAYSNSGIRKKGSKLEFEVKHWDSPSLEKAIAKYPAESRHDDIVIGENYVVRVATDDLTDPTNPDLREVLEGVSFVD